MLHSLLSDFLVAELQVRFEAAKARDWETVKISKVKCQQLEGALAAIGNVYDV